MKPKAFTYQDYYNTPGVREICHGVKQEDDLELKECCMEKMALYFAESGIITPDSFIIPAPQHIGHASYMRRVADKTASLTRASVLDIVRCVPHPPRYAMKLDDNEERADVSFYLDGEYPRDAHLVFVDNVISTGYTFCRINALFGYRLFPLPFAADSPSTVSDLTLLPL